MLALVLDGGVAGLIIFPATCKRANANDFIVITAVAMLITIWKYAVCRSSPLEISGSRLCPSTLVVEGHPKGRQTEPSGHLRDQAWRVSHLSARTLHHHPQTEQH